MIELTEQQVQAMESSGMGETRLVKPRTQETFVLLRLVEYERLKGEEYDDTPWTREELEALAWEAGQRGDWDEMEDDETPERQ